MPDALGLNQGTEKKYVLMSPLIFLGRHRMRASMIRVCETAVAAEDAMATDAPGSIRIVVELVDARFSVTSGI